MIVKLLDSDPDRDFYGFHDAGVGSGVPGVPEESDGGHGDLLSSRIRYVVNMHRRPKRFCSGNEPRPDPEPGLGPAATGPNFKPLHIDTRNSNSSTNTNYNDGDDLGNSFLANGTSTSSDMFNEETLRLYQSRFRDEQNPYVTAQPRTQSRMLMPNDEDAENYLRANLGLNLNLDRDRDDDSDSDSGGDENYDDHTNGQHTQGGRVVVDNMISLKCAELESIAVKNRIILCGLTLTIPLFLYLRFTIWN